MSFMSLPSSRVTQGLIFLCMIVGIKWYFARFSSMYSIQGYPLSTVHMFHYPNPEIHRHFEIQESSTQKLQPPLTLRQAKYSYITILILFLGMMIQIIPMHRYRFVSHTILTFLCGMILIYFHYTYCSYLYLIFEDVIQIHLNPYFYYLIALLIISFFLGILGMITTSQNIEKLSVSTE